MEIVAVVGSKIKQSEKTSELYFPSKCCLVLKRDLVLLNLILFSSHWHLALNWVPLTKSAEWPLFWAQARFIWLLKNATWSWNVTAKMNVRSQRYLPRPIPIEVNWFLMMFQALGRRSSSNPVADMAQNTTDYVAWSRKLQAKERLHLDRLGSDAFEIFLKEPWENTEAMLMLSILWPVTGMSRHRTCPLKALIKFWRKRTVYCSKLCLFRLKGMKTIEPTSLEQHLCEVWNGFCKRPR